MSDLRYINSSGREVLKYVPPDSIIFDLHFILTQNRMLTRKMPYMLLEKRVLGNQTTAIRLLDFYDKDGIVSLIVQELANNRTFTLSWNMEYTGNWWFWSLADFETLTGSITYTDDQTS